MDLEDLKTIWNSKEEFNNNETLLDAERVNKAISSKYHSKLKKILLPEIIITGVYFYFAALIKFKFSELETTTLEIWGKLAIVLLILLPVLRLSKLWNLYQLTNPNISYSNAIKKFAIEKIKFQKLQRLNINLAFFLILSVMVLSVKIYNEYDVTQSKYFWISFVFMTVLFVVIFNRLLTKKYNPSIEEAENLLQELENLSE